MDAENLNSGPLEEQGSEPSLQPNRSHKKAIVDYFIDGSNSVRESEPFAGYAIVTLNSATVAKPVQEDLSIESWLLG